MKQTKIGMIAIMVLLGACVVLSVASGAVAIIQVVG